MRPIITTVSSNKPGKKIAVFAGVHGNERAGVAAVRNLQSSLRPISGTVHFVLANPRAIEQGTRYVEKNLNRCFIKDNDGTAYEDRLARELMKLLDTCDALLDLHGYNGPEDQPFLIGEESVFDLAAKLNFPIVSSGWGVNGPGGTDSYMHLQGKIGLCAECGSNQRPEQYRPLAEQTIKQFLRYFGLLDNSFSFSSTKQRMVCVTHIVKKESAKLTFTKSFHNFELLPVSQTYAKDGSKEYQAGLNECIIFPRPNAKIGEEAFIIGQLK